MVFKIYNLKKSLTKHKGEIYPSHKNRKCTKFIISTLTCIANFTWNIYPAFCFRKPGNGKRPDGCQARSHSLEGQAPDSYAISCHQFYFLKLLQNLAVKSYLVPLVSAHCCNSHLHLPLAQGLNYSSFGLCSPLLKSGICHSSVSTLGCTVESCGKLQNIVITGSEPQRL